MLMFLILPVAGGTGYKIEISHPSGGVRVVGGVRSENEASAWVTNAGRAVGTAAIR